MKMHTMVREILANQAMKSPWIAERRNRAGRYSTATDSRPAIAQFNLMRSALGAVEGKVVAEIGGGDTLPWGMFLIGLGANRYLDVDRFAGDVAGPAAKAFYGTLAAHAPEDIQAGWRSRGLDPDKFPWPDLVRVVPASAESLTPDMLGGLIDAIISYNVLEHLSDPAVAFEAMARVMKPGGRMVHR